jgi:hypothetical protein
MAEHHPTVSPSALPMLAQCPCFEREAEKEVDGYADRGTLLHGVYETWMTGGKSSEEEKLTSFEKEAVKWAVDYTKMNASDGWPLELEKQLVLMDDDFNVVTFGTGDVVNGPRMFDLKTGDYHDYNLQVGCYALMQMDRIEEDRIDFHILFTRHKRAHMLTLIRDQIAPKVQAVIASVLDPEKKPRANPYCKWCRKIMTCEAVRKLVNAPEGTYEIEKPLELSDALKRAKVLEVWCERVSDYARKQAIAGLDIPFFMLKSRNGRREIADVKGAYERSGIPPERFIELCSVPVGAIEDAIADIEGVAKSAASKIVNERLGGVIVRRAPTVHLAPTQHEEPTE